MSRWIRRILTVGLWIGILCSNCTGIVQGKEMTEVTEVQDYKMMCVRLMEGMKKRQRKMCFYYPGICEDIAKDKKDRYHGLFETLARKDSYLVANIAAMSILYSNDADSCVTFSVTYRTTLRQEKYVDKKVKKLTRRRRRLPPPYKAKWARDYLVKHMRYDVSLDSAYAAFRYGRGNCMAYTLAYLRLMQEMGVPCIYVSGEEHAWNMVRLRSRWYSVDVTWDDATDSYSYFLKGTKDFRNHERIRFGWNRKQRMAKHRYIFR